MWHTTVMSGIHPMARQLAQLLTTSDLAELQEVVKRWVETAVSERQRKHFQEMGSRILELKAAFGEGPQAPTRDELELALSMMMALATDADEETRKRRAPKDP